MLRYISIRSKLALMLAVPLLCMAAFAFVGVDEKAKASAEARELQGLAELAVKTGAFVHESQKERGVTGGFVGSRGARFAQELPVQRRATDERRRALDAFLERFDPAALGGEFAAAFGKAIEAYGDLDAHRREVDRFGVDGQKAIGYYSALHTAFLDALAALTKGSTRADVGRSVVAFVNFLYAKEKTGQERAFLAQQIGVGHFDPASLVKFASIVAAQDTFVAEFEAVATAAERSEFRRAMSGPDVEAAAAFRKTAFEHADGTSFGIDGGRWYVVMTAKIDRMKRVEDYLSGELRALAARIQRGATAAQQTFIVAGAAALLVAIVLGAVIARGISRPLRRITETAARLAEGDVGDDVTYEARDEVGRLADSFRALTAYNRELATTLERISAGDVAVEVRPRSDADMLNVAAARMVDYLQNVASSLERISHGDLAVDLVARSDADALGQAARRMVAYLDAVAVTLDRVSVGDIEVAVEPDGPQDKLNLAAARMVEYLRDMAAALEQISRGDVAVSVTPQGSEDALGNTATEMVSYLQATAGALRAISSGDLSVDLEPRGDDDALGVAATGMVSYLREVAETLDKISLGDLDVSVSPRGEGDVLNTAADRMIASLRGIAVALSRISRGDVGVDVEPRSADDSLGAAARDMITYLRDVAGALAAIGQGDVGVDVALRCPEDALGAAATSMVDYLREVAATLDTISTGDLEVAVEPRGPDDTLNVAARRMVGYLSDVAGALDRISTGDLSVDVSPQGDTDMLGNAAARMIASLKSVAGALDRLGEGDLAVDVTPHAEHDVLGNAAARMIASLRETAQCLEAISAGRTDREVVARSENDTLALAVASLRQTVVELIAEITNLVRAAQRGDLAARADASRFAGEFAAIIEGINAALAAVVRPVDEAASVLGRVADRDLAARMRGTYEGDFAVFAAALNRAVDNLDSGLSQVAEGTGLVAVAAGQIADGSRSLAHTTSEQSSSLRELAASVAHTAVIARGSADEVVAMSDAVRSALGSVADGVDGMRRMSEAIGAIQTSAADMQRIIGAIDTIAEQTNLLALNANIEAQSAGTTGKGFKVVADEVRNLARRSAAAAKEIAGMIEAAVVRVDEGVEIDRQVSEVFDAIHGQMDGVGNATRNVGAASEEQTRGMEQAAAAVEELHMTVQHTASFAEEAAAASGELTRQAETMRSLVATFHLSSTADAGTVRELPLPAGAAHGVDAVDSFASREAAATHV